MCLADNVCIAFIFKGLVQGVGFRFIAKETAAKYRMAGKVRNLPDGTVEVIACGDKNKIDAFLSDIRAKFKYNITDINRTECSDNVIGEKFFIDF